jgi:hypothetical protein
MEKPHNQGQKLSGISSRTGAHQRRTSKKQQGPPRCRQEMERNMKKVRKTNLVQADEHQASDQQGKQPF